MMYNEFVQAFKEICQDRFEELGLVKLDDVQVDEEKKTVDIYQRFSYEPFNCESRIEVARVPGNQLEKTEVETAINVMIRMNDIKPVLKTYYYDNSDSLDYENDVDFCRAYLNDILDDYTKNEVDDYVSTTCHEAPYFVDAYVQFNNETETMEFGVRINDDAGYGRSSVPMLWAGESEDHTEIGLHEAYKKVVPMYGNADHDLSVFKRELAIAVSAIQ